MRVQKDTPSVYFEHVVQYLGTRSLVRFGAVAKSHGKIVSAEVDRRKKIVADIEHQVKTLLGPPDGIHLRKNVLRASVLVEEARMFIDDEVNLHDKICNPYCEMDCSFDKLFPNERKMFIAESYKPRGFLHILPLCFYLPPTGKSTSPTEDQIAYADRKASWLWGAEDHMQRVYECDQSLPDYDYDQPFRKFEHRLAQFFTCECLCETVAELAEANSIDAFRIAARKQIFRAPAARDCLWYTLYMADKSQST